jgi:hypothetical protein
MDEKNRHAPTWTAPGDLLPDVMSAVRAKHAKAPVGFFAWSVSRKILFGCAAAAAMAIASVGLPVVIDMNLLAAFGRLLTIVDHWYVAAGSLRDLAILLGSFVFRNPLLGVAALGMSALMMATWVLEVRFMCRILITQQRSRTA